MLFGSIVNTQLASNYKGSHQIPVYLHSFLMVYSLFVFMYAGHITHALPLKLHNLLCNFFFILS